MKFGRFQINSKLHHFLHTQVSIVNAVGDSFSAKFHRLLHITFACLTITLAGCESFARMAKEQQEAAESS